MARFDNLQLRRSTSCSRTARSGIATPYNVLAPTYYFGKGFGDLPDETGLAARLRCDRRGRLSDSEPFVRRGAAPTLVGTTTTLIPVWDWRCRMVDFAPCFFMLAP
jgi:hypothetical protein